MASWDLSIDLLRGNGVESAGGIPGGGRTTDCNSDTVAFPNPDAQPDPHCHVHSHGDPYASAEFDPKAHQHPTVQPDRDQIVVLASLQYAGITNLA